MMDGEAAHLLCGRCGGPMRVCHACEARNLYPFICVAGCKPLRPALTIRCPQCMAELYPARRRWRRQPHPNRPRLRLIAGGVVVLLFALIEGALVHAAYGQTPTLTPIPTVTATPTGGTHMTIDPQNPGDSSICCYRLVFGASAATPGPLLSTAPRGDGTVDAWVYGWQPSGLGPSPGTEIAAEAGNVFGLWSDPGNHAVVQPGGVVFTVTPNGAPSATPSLTASATVPAIATSTDTPTLTATATPTDTPTSTPTSTATSTFTSSPTTTPPATATATKATLHTRPTPPRIL